MAERTGKAAGSMSAGEKNLLTTGSVQKKMVRYALPLIVGNLFQQLYNAVDSLIVGNFVGSSALAAVTGTGNLVFLLIGFFNGMAIGEGVVIAHYIGAKDEERTSRSSSALAAVTGTGNLVFLLIGFFNGMAIGEGVVIAHYIGAKDEERTSRSVHTATALGLVISTAMTVVGVLATPVFLVWMGTPDSVMPEAILYLRIYFAGSVGLIMYNTFVGILQAAGDSTHPLYYLIFSSLMNVVLDLLFIAVFGMGVAGAAVATIISQMLSAILSLIRLMRTDSSIRVRLRAIRFDRPILGRMIRIGIPSGLQNSIIGFSNVVIQSYINAYGEFAMAGIGAYTKVEGFAFIPITSFSMALTTFVSQNLGAGEAGRVKKGVRFGGLTGILMAVVIGILTDVFAPQLIGAFNSNPEVIAYGVARARIVCPFFCLVSFSHLMAAILRGYGKANVPMIDFLVCWCVIRILIIAVGGLFIHSIYLTYWVYPITWTLSTLTMGIYYRKEEDVLTRCSQNLRGI